LPIQLVRKIPCNFGPRLPNLLSAVLGEGAFFEQFLQDLPGHPTLDQVRGQQPQGQPLILHGEYVAYQGQAIPAMQGVQKTPQFSIRAAEPGASAGTLAMRLDDQSSGSTYTRPVGSTTSRWAARRPLATRPRLDTVEVNVNGRPISCAGRTTPRRLF